MPLSFFGVTLTVMILVGFDILAVGHGGGFEPIRTRALDVWGTDSMLMRMDGSCSVA